MMYKYLIINNFITVYIAEAEAVLGLSLVDWFGYYLPEMRAFNQCCKLRRNWHALE